MPGWPDGIRRVGPDVRSFVDTEASELSQPYVYRIRAFWEQNRCEAPLRSPWVDRTVPTSGPPPPGAEAVKDCNPIELTAQPAVQTIRAQDIACIASGECPDAVVAFSIENVRGEPLNDVLLGVSIPTLPREDRRISIDSPFIPPGAGIDQSAVVLSEPGVSRLTALVSIGAPQTLFEPGELPAEWWVLFGARDCVLQTRVLVVE